MNRWKLCSNRHEADINPKRLSETDGDTEYSTEWGGELVLQVKHCDEYQRLLGTMHSC